MAEWPVCRARIEVAQMKLDCVRPKGHHLDGSPLHLTSLGVEWHIDMSLLDLGRAQRVYKPGDDGGYQGSASECIADGV